MKAFKRIKIIETVLYVLLIGIILVYLYQAKGDLRSSNFISILSTFILFATQFLQPSVVNFTLRKKENFIFPTDQYNNFRQSIFFFIPSTIIYFIALFFEFYFGFSFWQILCVGVLIVTIYVIMFINGKESTFSYIEIGKDRLFISDNSHYAGFELIFPKDKEEVLLDNDEIVLVGYRAGLFHHGSTSLVPEKKEKFSIPFDKLKENDLMYLKEFLKEAGVTKAKPKEQPKEFEWFALFKN